MATLGNAMKNEMAWDKTWNGADTLNTTFNACLDLFGRAGAMRTASVKDKQNLFCKAWDESNEYAIKLLFYIRDIRGGYGERDTFADMLRWLANKHPESVEKNLWAILEYGRAKDLYSLQGTKCEDAMWNFMKEQFELDFANMTKEKSISLLAKWIATPDASSPKTKALGQLTLRKLGYTKRNERDYKKKLRALRRYLDIPEAKMAAGKWSEIEYSKLGSQCLIKHRGAFARNDADRYQEFIDKASTGKVKMNTATMTPCDIIRSVNHHYTEDLDTMWANLPDYCNGNALVMCDTSGSMTWCSETQMQPIDVAIALSMYFAERNKGDLKNMFMTFESNPHLVSINGINLSHKYENILEAEWGNSTNLEAAFNLLLEICKKNNVSNDDMPDALVIVSDMQINHCVDGVSNERITFYDAMKRKYAAAGYDMPQVVFWNVNAVSPAFHASMDTAGVSLVSGYSPAIFKTVMESIGTTPMELMLKAVINNERYADISA